MASAMMTEDKGFFDDFSFKTTVRQYSKVITVVGAILSLLLVAAVTNVLTSKNAEVKLNVNGVVRPVEGWMATTSDALEIAHVSVSAHDLVTPALDAPIKDGQTITIQSGHQVYVRDGSEVREMWVTSRSILDSVQAIKLADQDLTLIVQRSGIDELPIAMQEVKVTIKDSSQTTEAIAPAGMSVARLFERNDVSVDPLDEVTAFSSAPGTLTLNIDKISRSIVTEEEDIDFETETKESDELYEGQKRVVTKGVKGLKVTTYAVHKLNDKETKKETISSDIKEEPTTEVVEVGTKKRPASSGGSYSASDRPAAPANPSDVQQYARSILSDYGWSDDQFGCLVALFNRESGWRWNAHNSSSGAYGIPQALPGSKMASAGADWRTNPNTQVRWGMSYIKGRYSTPCEANAIQRSRGWY